MKKFLIILLILAGTLCLLEYKGMFWHNNIFAAYYTVRGIDVSHYQGQIDWQAVSHTGTYSFVYLKATEGDSLVDEQFVRNSQEARKVGIKVGAYHFFSMQASGQAQAAYFIEHVPKESIDLAPVIDVEIDPSFDPVKVRQELGSMSAVLESYYGKKPVLYATGETYGAFIKGPFPDNVLWIRNMVLPPVGKKWLFWQYSNRGHVTGITGAVDLDVFNGTPADLQRLGTNDTIIDTN